MDSLYLVFSLVVCGVVYGRTEINHYGTDFNFGMFPHRGSAYDTIIDIASKREGTVQLNVPYLNTRVNSTLKRGITSLKVNRSLLKEGAYLENRGIQVKTDIPVSVYVTTFPTNYATETCVILPRSALGTTYKVASYEPYDGSGDYSYILIIGESENTTVSTNFGNNTIQILSVNQIVSKKDLTQTAVLSDKPISVISGTSCALVGHDLQGCDALLEQMIPTIYWKKHYIVSPVYPKSGFIIKVLTTDNQPFCVFNSTGQFCNLFTSRPEDEILNGPGPIVVTSSVPFSVILYSFGEEKDGIIGDDFMTVVPGVDSYMNDYYFVVPPVYSSVNNYLSVVVPSVHASGLLLNELPLSVIMRYDVPFPYNNYSVIIANISVGYNELKHRNITVRFGATIYGLAHQLGYGFSAGYLFAEESTETQKTCYSCQDMLSLEVCDAVQLCGRNETCYAEKYVSRSGTYFKSGCIEKETCQLVNTTQKEAVCLECCNESFCNNKGCGDNRFPDRSERGPMCYDCQHVPNDPKLCNKVTMCSMKEVCSIEQYTWGNDFHYKMGCTHSLCSPMRRSMYINENRVERSTPVCSSCCTDDFCNLNCTTGISGDLGQVIIG